MQFSIVWCISKATTTATAKRKNRMKRQPTANQKSSKPVKYERNLGCLWERHAPNNHYAQCTQPVCRNVLFRNENYLEHFQTKRSFFFIEPIFLISVPFRREKKTLHLMHTRRGSNKTKITDKQLTNHSQCMHTFFITRKSTHTQPQKVQIIHNKSKHQAF